VGTNGSDRHDPAGPAHQRPASGRPDL